MNTQQISKKPQKIRRSSVGTGTTSLLMIFTVLCFATLAMLSLSTASSNQRIQKRGFERTASVVAAQGIAAEKLAEIDARLQQAQWAASSEDAYYTTVFALAPDFNAQADSEAKTWVFTVPLDENSELVTVLEILPPGGAGRYTIRTQASRMSGEWTPESQGQLWTGE